MAFEPPSRMCACTAAPSATTSSGLSSVWGFLPRCAELEDLISQTTDERNARRAADENDFVDLLGREAGVFQGLLAGADGAVEHRLDDLFKLLAGDLAAIGRAVGQIEVDVSPVSRGERDLGFDDRLANCLHGLRVCAEIETVFAEDVVESNRDEEIVDIVAAEVGVSVGGDHFEDAIVQLEDGNVESSAAEVVDGDDTFLLAVESISEGRCGGLVDQAQDFESGHAARILCGLALRVVEVGRDGNDGLA